MLRLSHQGLRDRIFLLTLAVLSLFFGLTSCEEQDVQDIRIAAQDFRFQPASFSLKAHEPVRITLVNEGRTVHEFTSRLFTDPQTQMGTLEHPLSLSSQGVIQVKPGQQARITFQAAAGTYFFRCRIKGHKGMDGMLKFE